VPASGDREDDCGEADGLAGETEVLGENLPQRQITHNHFTRRQYAAKVTTPAICCPTLELPDEMLVGRDSIGNAIEVS
jgi:hypothetical protein